MVDKNKMIHASKIVSYIVDELKDFLRSGISEKDINLFCKDRMDFYQCKSAAYKYKGFPSYVCISTNNIVCHGIASNRILKNGDIVSIDIAIEKNHHFGDTCFTYQIGNVSSSRAKIIHAAYECMWETIKIIKPGVSIGTLGFTMKKTAEKFGFDTVKEFCGHGIGHNFHEEPYIPFFGTPYSGPLLKNNQYITIEPMVIYKNNNLKILEDNWTAVCEQDSAQFEHTIFVKPNGFEVLTYNKFDEQNKMPKTK